MNLGIATLTAPFVVSVWVIMGIRKWVIQALRLIIGQGNRTNKFGFQPKIAVSKQFRMGQMIYFIHAIMV